MAAAPVLRPSSDGHPVAVQMALEIARGSSTDVSRAVHAKYNIGTSAARTKTWEFGSAAATANTDAAIAIATATTKLTGADSARRGY